MTPPDDKQLEKLLRDGLGRPPLCDSGFTARVLDRLPQRRPLLYYRAMVALGWIGAAAGISLALWAACPGSVTSAAHAIRDAWLSFAAVATLMSCLAALHGTGSVSGR
jgi:hypothetical protein